MSYSYKILAEAQEEYEKSLQWYLARSQSAGVNFVESVEEALLLICSHPRRWRNAYKDFYEKSLKKYPYSVIYQIEESTSTILIVSIYHQHRNPQKKYFKK